MLGTKKQITVISPNPVKSEAAKIAESLSLYPDFYCPNECRHIESLIDATALLARMGHFRGTHTTDVKPRRTKYFFGSGYTYGYGMRGREELLPYDAVDPIPLWIHQHIIRHFIERGFVKPGWVNAIAINDYQEGGSIVAHVDPPHLFDRPIFTATFFSPGKLVFGASFDPQRSQPPVYEQLLPRGAVLILDGYAANEVTHGMRPEDMLGCRRVSIVLRHTLENAPIQGVPLMLSDCFELCNLIQHVQGHWHDPSNRNIYIVQQLDVNVLTMDWSWSGEGVLTTVAKWQLMPVKQSLICNDGILHSDGVFERLLQWRPLQRTKVGSLGFTWIRMENDF